MGWKLSMISVKAPSVAKVDDLWLLEKLGYSGVKYVGEVAMEEVVNPGDNSVSIGEWNGNLIICEDHVLTERADVTATPSQLLEYEAILTAIFPGSEVLSVANHSVVNYHLYALARDGQRQRYKQISGDTPRKEFGELIEEEKVIYSWGEISDEVTEDQLMEDFAFGVAERHLGFRIDEGEEIFDIKLRKYSGGVPKAEKGRPLTVNEMLAGQQAGEEEGGAAASPWRGVWATLKWWFGKW